MPSHISHSVFASHLIENLRGKGAGENLTDNAINAINIGAQGPDIFYHNQRSTPSGLLIGSVLHRKGYASVSARMLEYCLVNSHDQHSPQGLYLLSFISHGIMDRIFHPYINYKSGWVDGNKPETEKYRFCHPFFERIIDVALTLAQHPESTDFSPSAEQPLNPYGFAQKFDAGEVFPSEYAHMLEFALRGVYSRMARDEQLQERIQNAYIDSRGFYHFSESSRGKNVPLRWAALLHPAMLPPDIDFLNSRGENWKDPCSDELNSDVYSVFDLYEAAMEEALAVCTPVYEILSGGDPPEDYPGLPVQLGDHSLRSNIHGEDRELPCTLTHSDPLPLKAVLEVIASGDIPSSWQRADRVLSPVSGSSTGSGQV